VAELPRGALAVSGDRGALRGENGRQPPAGSADDVGGRRRKDLTAENGGHALAQRPNLIERAKRHAAAMYPDAKISTRNVRGRPVVLALEANLIRLIRFEDLDRDERPRARARR
jgi:hypothetical protein